MLPEALIRSFQLKLELDAQKLYDKLLGSMITSPFVIATFIPEVSVVISVPV